MDGNTSIWSSDNYDPVSIKLCVKKLKEEFGQQFSDSQSILEQHTHTMTIHESELPNGVVFVETKEDVQKVVNICIYHSCNNLCLCINTIRVGIFRRRPLF